jgi:hypothetical protein
MCAYFLGKLDDARECLLLPKALISHDQDSPIAKLVELLLSRFKKRETRIMPTSLQRFDAEYRKALDLMQVRQVEENFSESVSKEFALSREEAGDVLGFLDSIASESHKPKA